MRYNNADVSVQSTISSNDTQMINQMVNNKGFVNTIVSGVVGNYDVNVKNKNTIWKNRK
jgi:hypothetical protein